MQTSSTILMVRPVRFGFNEQTASNNTFQKRGFEKSAQERALEEFDNFVSLLRSNGVNVIVVNDTAEPHTPDSIFPNNWFSTHETGELVLYPMCAPNRRLERKESVINLIKSNIKLKKLIDLTGWEEKGLFLEGTGSMILDRENKLAFVCRSPRSDEAVLKELCDELDYEYFIFSAYDSDDSLIYHTNVMMCVGSEFVVACLDSIKDIDERQSFIELVEDCDKELIEISMDQMDNFAGNMLEIKNNSGESLLIMSSTAKKSISPVQITKLTGFCKILSPDISVIEANGGGSARCMMAEIF